MDDGRRNLEEEDFMGEIIRQAAGGPSVGDDIQKEGQGPSVGDDIQERDDVILLFLNDTDGVEESEVGSGDEEVDRDDVYHERTEDEGNALRSCNSNHCCWNSNPFATVKSLLLISL